MSYSYTELGRRWREDSTRGSASRVRVEEHEWGGTMLVAYGHAVYGYRFPDGFTIGFRGWYNPDNERHHSGGCNKQQMRNLGLLNNVDAVVEGTEKEAAPRNLSFEPYEWEHLKPDNQPQTASMS